MRGRGSLCQYSQPLFFFIETNPEFNRYDVIDRVIKTLNKLFVKGYEAYFIIDKGMTVELIRCRNGFSSKALIMGISAYLVQSLYALNNCSTIVLLSEEGDYELGKLFDSDCFLLGLHSDIDKSLIQIIESTNKIIKVRLSEIPYMTSQCIYIIEYILNNLV